MITRRIASTCRQSENAIVSVKNDGFKNNFKTKSCTRSRAALCDLQNVNLTTGSALENPRHKFLKHDLTPEKKSENEMNLFLGAFNLSIKETQYYAKFFNQCGQQRQKIMAKNKDLYKDIDKDIVPDDASLSAFAGSVFNYLQTYEFIIHPLSSSFLTTFKVVTPRLRYVLINWLVKIHRNYALQPETLYLCVAIMDRYLQKCGSAIDTEHFQLLGITCLFLAAKFEEMYPPDIGDFSFMTENTFSKNDIRNYEQLILQSLNFNISFPTPICFLRRFSKILEVDRLMHNLAKYFLELTIQEYDLAYLPGNLRATIAICLSLAVCYENPSIDHVWNHKLAFISGYTLEDIRIPSQTLAKAVYRQNSPSKYRAIYDKYRLDDLYDKVASLSQLRSTIMESLANLEFDDEGTEIINNT